MKKTVVLSLLLVLGFFIGNAFGAEAILSGPNRYVRTSGGPDLYTGTFSGVPGEGRMVVKNGNIDGSNRIIDAISSGRCMVNGVEIFGPTILISKFICWKRRSTSSKTTRFQSNYGACRTVF